MATIGVEKMSNLLDPRDKKTGKYPFVYRSAAATDISATFARIRREQREQAEAEQERTVKVRQLKKGKA